MLIIRIPVSWVYEGQKVFGGVGGDNVAIAGSFGEELLLVWLV